MSVTIHSEAGSRPTIQPTSVADARKAGQDQVGQDSPAARPASAELAATGTVLPAAAGSGQDGIESLFRDQFRARAQDPAGFHELIRSVYGNGVNTAVAEAIRQQAVNGQFDWLPQLRMVDSDALRVDGGPRTAAGAYDAATGSVLIDRNLTAAQAERVYVEEVGHHLDTLLKGTDTVGDEGEMFRRLLHGERLDAQQVQAIRSDPNDKGTIQVNGRAIEAEFFLGGFGEAIGNAASAVGNAVGNAASAVGNAIGDGARAVGNAIGDGARALGNAIGNGARDVRDAAVDFGKGVVDAGKAIVEGGQQFVGGLADAALDGARALGRGALEFGGHMLRGEFGDGFRALGRNLGDAGRGIVNGLDRAFLQAPNHAMQGVLRGARDAVGALTGLVPGGDYVRGLTDRMFDGAMTVTDAVIGAARDVLRAPAELSIDAMEGLSRTLGHLVDGDVQAAGRELVHTVRDAGVGFFGRFVDAGARGLRVGADLVGLALGEPPARSLTTTERQYLEQIYGDALDYDTMRIRPGGVTDWVGMRAHVVGNTVYMPDAYFGPNGALTPQGVATLGHEAGHVWQNQNGGGDYIHEALGAQLGAQLQTGTPNAAYDFVSAIRNGTTFDNMNPEQQASVAEAIGLALANDGIVTQSDFPGLNAAEYGAVIDAWDQIRAGQGAP